MYIFGVIVSILISSISLIVSIVSLCSIGSHDLDTDSVILSTLSIITASLIGIVALLIGWQIWKTIETKNLVSEVGMSKYLIRSYVMTLYAMQYELSNSAKETIDHYISAIDLAVKVSDKDAIELPIRKLIVMSRNRDIWQIKKDKRRYYIRTLNRASEIVGCDTDIIIGQLLNAKED